jgi:thioredoxin 1
VYIVRTMLNEERLRQLRDHPRPMLVLCLCAEWCDTCTDYRPGFYALAARFPDCDFVWADIEDDAQWVGRFDVENFPTLLIQHGSQVLSYGVLLPHISHLEKLIESLSRMSESERAAWIASPERAAWQGEFNWRAQLHDALPI